MAESERGRDQGWQGQLTAASYVGCVRRILEQIAQLLAVVRHSGLVDLPLACPQFNHFE